MTLLTRHLSWAGCGGSQRFQLAGRPGYLTHYGYKKRREIVQTGRSYSQVSKGLSLIKSVNGTETKKLVLILSWIQAQQKPLQKYANFYLNHQSDAVIVYLKAQDYIWPKSGVKMLAQNLVEFLCKNENYQQIVVHGFSSGCTAWGEVLKIMEEDPRKLEFVRERLVGQVWDSISMIRDTETVIQTSPKSVFPNNKYLESLMRNFLRFHLKVFHASSAVPNLQSMSRVRESTLFKVPILVFGSRDDPVATIQSLEDLMKIWKDNGNQVEGKIWDSSPHVGHLLRHPKEYEETLKAFLRKLDFL